MENFNQIESDILNKIKNIKDRNSYDQLKLKFLEKKELLQNFLKRLEL